LSAFIEEKKSESGAPAASTPSSWSSSLYSYITCGCSRYVAVRSQNDGTLEYARKKGRETSTKLHST
jgi:hypothetical protein